MEQTTRIELANQDDLVAVRLRVMRSEDVRRLTVEDALVDTGATGLCLPAPLIKQLGLTPLRKVQAQTANSIVERVIYSEVEYTVLQRSDSIPGNRPSSGYACPPWAHDLGSPRSLC